MANKIGWEKQDDSPLYFSVRVTKIFGKSRNWKGLLLSVQQKCVSPFWVHSSSRSSPTNRVFGFRNNCSKQLFSSLVSFSSEVYLRNEICRFSFLLLMIELMNIIAAKPVNLFAIFSHCGMRNILITWWATCFCIRTIQQIVSFFQMKLSCRCTI